MLFADIKYIKIRLYTQSFYVFVESGTLLLKSLEDKHKLSMLVFLFENGRSKKTDIYSGLPKNISNANKLDDLEKLKLVTFDHRSLNNTTYVELTELGQCVAKKLMDIEHLMRGETVDEMADDRVDHGAPSEEGNKVR